jgi:hypothetical protein
VGAQLWERFSPRLPFYVTGLAALGSAIPAWLKFKLPKNGGPDESAVINPSIKDGAEETERLME